MTRTRPQAALRTDPRAAVTTALPCRDDPELWFHKQSRPHALKRCLACPARPACARAALDGDATWGMWAGIWIEDNLTDVQHHLRAIATLTHQPAVEQMGLRSQVCTPPPQPDKQPHDTVLHDAGGPPQQIWRPDLNQARSLSVPAQIEIRSTMHCEVMAVGCRHDFAHIIGRIPDTDWRRTDNAASAYAACDDCAATITSLDTRFAQRLGYILRPTHNPHCVPLFWRQTHWMLLGPSGGLQKIDQAA